MEQVEKEKTEIINLTQGKQAIVDADKLALISNYKWFACKSRNGVFYAGTKINGKLIKLHRFLLDVTDSKIIIDHINHDGLDNRMSNLRICTNHQNIINTSSRKNSTSKYLGVCYKPIRKRKLKSGNLSTKEYIKKWVAQIQFNNKKKFIGRFETEVDAAIAYNNHAKLFFKEYANLNKI